MSFKVKKVLFNAVVNPLESRNGGMPFVPTIFLAISQDVDSMVYSNVSSVIHPAILQTLKDKKL